MSQQLADFQRLQMAFAAHLRAPQTHAPPPELEDRRLQIYRDLFYNNIEGFLRGAFPVMRAITADDAWHALVRDFFSSHRCADPQFYSLASAFVEYLAGRPSPPASEPAFLLELAHYEWVELALSLAEDPVLEKLDLADEIAGEPLDVPLLVSPLAWALSYHWPVHRLGPDHLPTQAPPEPTHIVVYRNADDDVRFLQVNALTRRLLQLLDEQPLSGREALMRIGAELQTADSRAVIEQGQLLLLQLLERGILLAGYRCLDTRTLS